MHDKLKKLSQKWGSVISKASTVLYLMLSQIFITVTHQRWQNGFAWWVQYMLGYLIYHLHRKNVLTAFPFLQVFDFTLRKEDMQALENMGRTITCVDRSSIQNKLDNPLPDGYKLKLSKLVIEPWPWRLPVESHTSLSEFLTEYWYNWWTHSFFYQSSSFLNLNVPW